MENGCFIVYNHCGKIIQTIRNILIRRYLYADCRGNSEQNPMFVDSTYGKIVAEFKKIDIMALIGGRDLSDIEFFANAELYVACHLNLEK